LFTIISINIFWEEGIDQPLSKLTRKIIRIIKIIKMGKNVVNLLLRYEL